jgi:type I restriction enzyme S subunit
LQTAVAAAKSKILSLAIRGKLVPQDPADEPASVLLERTRAEKEKLGGAGNGKRKKGGDSGAASRDNSYYGKLPFDLPETWRWYRLSECWDLLSGRDLSPTEYTAEPVGIPYITGASNFTKDELIINRWTDCPKVVAKDGDLLITCKGTVGAMRIHTQGDAHIARQIMALRDRSGLNTEFLQIVMTSFIQQITSAAKGMIPGISREDLLDMTMPCPPIQEQARIVAAVNEAHSVMNEITASLS